jgi:NADH dehydrogenase FAD-containing subunit
MKKHLVFVGGGHAHLTALLHLKDYIDCGHRVTLISSSVYHYYSGMGPGMLSGIYRPQEIRFHVKKLTEDRGASFLEDRVIRISPSEQALLRCGLLQYRQRSIRRHTEYGRREHFYRKADY